MAHPKVLTGRYHPGISRVLRSNPSNMKWSCLKLPPVVSAHTLRYMAKSTWTCSYEVFPLHQNRRGQLMKHVSLCKTAIYRHPFSGRSDDYIREERKCIPVRPGRVHWKFVNTQHLKKPSLTNPNRSLAIYLSR